MRVRFQNKYHGIIFSTWPNISHGWTLTGCKNWSWTSLSIYFLMKIIALTIQMHRTSKKIVTQNISRQKSQNQNEPATPSESWVRCGHFEPKGGGPTYTKSGAIILSTRWPESQKPFSAWQRCCAEIFAVCWILWKYSPKFTLFCCKIPVKYRPVFMENKKIYILFCWQISTKTAATLLKISKKKIAFMASFHQKMPLWQISTKKIAFMENFYKTSLN